MSSDEPKEKHPPVPYDRFKEIVDQKKRLETEIVALKAKVEVLEQIVLKLKRLED